MTHTATLPLSLFDQWVDSSLAGVVAKPSHLPRVQSIWHQGAMLQRSALGPPEQVLGLNLTTGCAHQCAYCPARELANYPGDDLVLLLANAAERLRDELAQRSPKPRAVHLSATSDPFPPLYEVQAETARVLDVLAEQGIQMWLETRGYIRPFAVEVLARHARLVKLTVGLTTLDRGVQRLLEPLTAPPSLRLRQIRQLRQRGIAVQVALEPLVPGLTDTPENLRPLLAALADIGINRVIVGYMMLKPNMQVQVQRMLDQAGLAEQVLDAYIGGPLVQRTTRLLPKAERQHRYATLMALAAEYGITVSLSAASNPDFQPAAAPVRVPSVPLRLSRVR